MRGRSCSTLAEEPQERRDDPRDWKKVENRDDPRDWKKVEKTSKVAYKKAHEAKNIATAAKAKKKACAEAEKAKKEEKKAAELAERTAAALAEKKSAALARAKMQAVALAMEQAADALVKKQGAEKERQRRLVEQNAADVAKKMKEKTAELEKQRNREARIRAQREKDTASAASSAASATFASTLRSPRHVAPPDVWGSSTAVQTTTDVARGLPAQNLHGWSLLAKQAWTCRHPECDGREGQAEYDGYCCQRCQQDHKLWSSVGSDQWALLDDWHVPRGVHCTGKPTV